MSEPQECIGRNGVAFFDVDETLLTIKSMVSFYRYHCVNLPAAERHTRLDRLDDLLESGIPRERANTDFYRLIEGTSVAELAESGRRWFTDVAIPALNTSVLTRLQSHKQQGHAIVLVSGSFPACLNPVSAYVGADMILCSRPAVAEGRYTGRLATPMIGNGKAAAVADILDTIPTSAPSWAYGDHESDLPMLLLVDNPVVVGADAVLNTTAVQRGWDTIESTAHGLRPAADTAAPIPIGTL
ncbi:hypothetical protein BJD99_01375 [Rhodococcus sp. 1163]|uniref:HAD family hydrolase n=1 Tax=Rhodococcus sp. 1163 TaxID=1905289 RepID=UPI000A0D897B|nr:HAD-IB family hydrolase [Rhodococcus sp. 1163]ORI19696.1 hypothetical protein BJD99_01375 [Rhodococcus sp. 1163]